MSRQTSWIHAAIGDFNRSLTPKEQNETTECGKTARRIMATFNKDQVTCPPCLTKLKEDNWFCDEHGFIEDINVEFDETCSTCGMSAV